MSYWSFNVSDADSGQDVSEFNWDDYLEENGALSVPHHVFKHVSKCVASLCLFYTTILNLTVKLKAFN